MTDIQKRVSSGGVRWDVRYRDESRRQRKKSLEHKVDAQRFAASFETDLIRGDWIDPDRGRELFEHATFEESVLPTQYAPRPGHEATLTTPGPFTSTFDAVRTSGSSSH